MFAIPDFAVSFKTVLKSSESLAKSILCTGKCDGELGTHHLQVSCIITLKDGTFITKQFHNSFLKIAQNGSCPLCIINYEGYTTIFNDIFSRSLLEKPHCCLIQSGRQWQTNDK